MAVVVAVATAAAVAVAAAPAPAPMRSCSFVCLGPAILQHTVIYGCCWVYVFAMCIARSYGQCYSTGVWAYELLQPLVCAPLHRLPYIVDLPSFPCAAVVMCRQVIEKAYKKLRLDALVIQQGRLTENQGSKVC
jgi:hypothetical protein